MTLNNEKHIRTSMPPSKIGRTYLIIGLVIGTGFGWLIGHHSSPKPVESAAEQNIQKSESHLVEKDAIPATLTPQAKDEQTTKVIPEETITANKPAVPTFEDIDYTVKSGDTLEKIFNQKHLSTNDLYAVLDADEAHLVLDVLKPGDQLSFRVSIKDHTLKQVSVIIDPSKTITYVSQQGGFAYHEKLTPITSVMNVTRGKIEGSFFISASAAGLTDNSIMTISQLLKNSLNFNRSLRAGDDFQVVIEHKTINGKTIGNGRLLAARILSQGKEYGAYLNDNGSYYNAKGESLIPALLRYPTAKRFRISSSFNAHRHHPVTGLIKPHYGTDFATPIGTPVLATGNGRVTRIANHRYAGKYIDIDEFGPYSTRFMHLSKILVKKGQHVERGQVIGLSGNTGRTTGPHLHYELHINGKPVNAMTAKIPVLKSISHANMQHFKQEVSNMQGLMQSQQSSVVVESKADTPKKEANVG